MEQIHFIAGKGDVSIVNCCGVKVYCSCCVVFCVCVNFCSFVQSIVFGFCFLAAFFFNFMLDV